LALAAPDSLVEDIHARAVASYPKRDFRSFQTGYHPDF
jgi:hypothetical protein